MTATAELNGVHTEPATRVVIEKIITDARLQARDQKAPPKALVEQYAEHLRQLDPVTLVRLGEDGGGYVAGTYLLVDGHTTLEAHALKEMATVPARVVDGDWRHARILAAGANAEHGMPRSPADKARAVRMLLEETADEERVYSDGWYKERAKVSDHFVKKVRLMWQAEQRRKSKPRSERAEQARVGRDNKTYTVKPKKAKRGGFEPRDYAKPIADLSRVLDRMYKAFKLLDSHGAVKRDTEYKVIDGLVGQLQQAFMDRYQALSGPTGG
jgi:ParB-like chromosome segregation protein Spo0J